MKSSRHKLLKDDEDSVYGFNVSIKETELTAGILVVFPWAKSELFLGDFEYQLEDHWLKSEPTLIVNAKIKRIL